MTKRWTVLALVLTGMLVTSTAPGAAPDRGARQTARPADAGAPDTTLRGRVQSVQEAQIVLRTDDGRVVSVDAKDISAPARGLVQKGEPIVVTGVLAGDRMTARSLTVAASAPGARALAGQPPFVPEDPGAASPAQRDPPRR